MTGGIGLAILRIGLGLLLTGHACQKLFGWFRGHGLAGTGGFFDSIGYRPGRHMAALAGTCELTAGVLLALGLLTPLGAAIAVGVMLAAGAVHVANGLWASDGGFELPAFYAVSAAALGFTGPGRYSLDQWLGLSWGWRYGLAALAVGIFAGNVAAAFRARQLRHAATNTAAAATTAAPAGDQPVPAPRNATTGTGTFTPRGTPCPHAGR